jgi:nitronate monooxygenase
MDVRALFPTPVIVAPMAGGPSTPELLAAASAAGAFGFVAGGYLSADELRERISPQFGVNLFVPSAPAPRALVDAYVKSLERSGYDLAPAEWNDDDYDAKLDVVGAARPPAVSFAFGCPPADVVARLDGSAVIVTVTSPEEARVAVEAGADALAVQGIEAGAHRGSWLDGDDYELLLLLKLVREVCDLPLIAAGGIASAAAVQRVLDAGAIAAQVGTAFLRCPESGASFAHKAALADMRFATTAVTRAFTGRRARGLVNPFMRDHPDAPAAYPEIHVATRPMRTAAAAAGDTDRMNLWAGTSWQQATDKSAGEIVEMLLGR